jgi:hypothetical protein
VFVQVPLFKQTGSPVVVSMQLVPVCLYVCAGFWLLPYWAADTPTRAAAIRATPHNANTIFLFIFVPHLPIGLPMVWMLAETKLKRFVKQFFDCEKLPFL